MKTKLPITFEALYNGCLYYAIAHAVFVAKHPIMSYAHSWDGFNYCFQYGSATRGTITFDILNNILVGAIRDDKSIRRSWYPTYTAAELFDEAPDAAKVLAYNHTLQYLFDEIEGVTAPVATTAFWSEGNQIVSRDDLSDFVEHGGEFIIETIALTAQEMQAYWIEEDYGFTPEEFELIDYLFHLKKTGKMAIEKSDIVVIDEHSKGYKESIELLSEIGFEFMFTIEQPEKKEPTSLLTKLASFWGFNK